MNKNISEQDRKEKISSAINKDSYEYFTMNKQKYKLSKIEIDEKYLLYRLDNTRTRLEQLAYISNQNLSEDFFSTQRTTNNEVQEAQGKILANSQSQSDLKALDAKFKQDGMQSEDLTILSNGWVVNGNRRLAYMRQQDSGYSTINCSILPKALEEKYLEVEAYLDISADIKVPYAWYNIGHKMLERRDKGDSDQKIAKENHLTLKEVQINIESVKYALDVMALQNETDIEQIKNSQQIYEDYAKEYIKETDFTKRESIKAAVMLVHNVSKDVLKGTNANKNKNKLLGPLLRNPKILNDVLVEEFPKEGDGVKNDPFGEDLGSKKVFNQDKLNKIFIEKNQKEIDLLFQKADDKIKEKNDDLSEEKNKSQFINNLTKAKNNLSGSIDSYREDSYIDKLEEVLTEVLESVEKIKQKIKDR